MLVCGCGGWMHTEGVEERLSREGDATWFVRSECRPCRWIVGVDVPVGQVDGLVDRLMWTDDARHRLDRVPPYAVPVLRAESMVCLMPDSSFLSVAPGQPVTNGSTEASSR